MPRLAGFSLITLITQGGAKAEQVPIYALLVPRSSACAACGARPALAAMAAPLSDDNKLAQDLLLQMKDYTPTVRCLAASPSHPQP